MSGLAGGGPNFVPCEIVFAACDCETKLSAGSVPRSLSRYNNSWPRLSASSRTAGVFRKDAPAANGFLAGRSGGH